MFGLLGAVRYAPGLSSKDDIAAVVSSLDHPVIGNHPDSRRPRCRWALDSLQNFVGNFAGIIAPALTGFVVDTQGRKKVSRNEER
jgi:hypothetical protein